MAEMKEELARAATMLDLGRYDEASTLLARLVSAEPGSGRAWCLFARAHLGADRFTDAVTAAAGNFSTSRRFYPAAFADLAPMPVQAPLISVGALNPDGSKALFSDGGTWIRAWASGAAMISTFPADINGSRDPEVRRPAHPANVLPDGLSLPPWRAALDQDDFTSGFAAWSGTSFAAPVLAAVLAAELLAQITPDNGLKLDVSGAAAAVQRLAQALQTLGWPG